MKGKKTLGALLLAGAIGLSSCEDYRPKQKHIEGTILEESGTIVYRQKVFEKSKGALFGNESVKFGDPTYAIKIKADNGSVYSLGVYGSTNDLEALNLAINVGTKIDINSSSANDSVWLENRFGSIPEYKIKVLPKK